MIKEIAVLGLRIDDSSIKQNDMALVQCINDADSLLSRLKLTDEDQAILYYYRGNAWASLDHIRMGKNNGDWDYKRQENDNAIIDYRRCINVPITTNDSIAKQSVVQASVNLGNTFSQAGRIIYANECWDLALKMNADYGMAGCNKAHGLIYYSSYMYEKSHTTLILVEAYRLLDRYLSSPDIFEEAKAVFLKDKENIEKAVSYKLLSSTTLFTEFDYGKCKESIDYHKWANINRLYLNPLNDIYIESAVAQDFLHLPGMKTKYPAPVFQSFYNQIKQEYISARYFFYCFSIMEDGRTVHFSDENRHLFDTLDYPQYGLKYEYLKIAFRMAYSILDKIGYFINEYFGLGIPKTKVNFRTLWYDEKGKGTIKDKLSNLKNNPLRGLFFLSRDFHEQDSEYLGNLDPVAKQLAEIRNYIEHKHFKIHWHISSERPENNHFYDHFAFNISDDLLSEKTLRIIKTTREAIIYLSLAVHVDEEQNDIDGLYMPLLSQEYDW